MHRKVEENLANIEKPSSIYGTVEDMVNRAGSGGMDMERNLVYCPSGEMLRQKCIKKNGNIRYANKSVCKHCKNRNKSYKGNDEWKEIVFPKGKLEKPCSECRRQRSRNVRRLARNQKSVIER